MIVKCPDCATQYRIPESKIGIKFYCKKCRGVVDTKKTESAPPAMPSVAAPAVAEPASPLPAPEPDITNPEPEPYISIPSQAAPEPETEKAPESSQPKERPEDIAERRLRSVTNRRTRLRRLRAHTKQIPRELAAELSEAGVGAPVADDTGALANEAEAQVADDMAASSDDVMVPVQEEAVIPFIDELSTAEPEEESAVEEEAEVEPVADASTSLEESETQLAEEDVLIPDVETAETVESEGGIAVDAISIDEDEPVADDAALVAEEDKQEIPVVDEAESEVALSEDEEAEKAGLTDAGAIPPAEAIDDESELLNVEALDPGQVADEDVAGEDELKILSTDSFLPDDYQPEAFDDEPGLEDVEESVGADEGDLPEDSELLDAEEYEGEAELLEAEPEEEELFEPAEDGVQEESDNEGLVSAGVVDEDVFDESALLDEELPAAEIEEERAEEEHLNVEMEDEDAAAEEFEADPDELGFSEEESEEEAAGIAEDLDADEEELVVGEPVDDEEEVEVDLGDPEMLAVDDATPPVMDAVADRSVKAWCQECFRRYRLPASYQHRTLLKCTVCQGAIDVLPPGVKYPFPRPADEAQPDYPIAVDDGIIDGLELLEEGEYDSDEVVELALLGAEIGEKPETEEDDMPAEDPLSGDSEEAEDVEGDEGEEGVSQDLDDLDDLEGLEDEDNLDELDVDLDDVDLDEEKDL